MKKYTAAGFTMIELMVTIAVLAVLLGIAVPSFTNISNANRVTSSTNEFITALNLTRSEATKRSQPVTICPSNAGQTACVDSTDWATGWIVFVDDLATAGTIETGETIIQVWPPANGITVTQDSTSSFVRYGRNGAPVGGVTATFDIVRAVANTFPRCVSVATTGRVNLDKNACP